MSHRTSVLVALLAVGTLVVSCASEPSPRHDPVIPSDARQTGDSIGGDTSGDNRAGDVFRGDTAMGDSFVGDSFVGDSFVGDSFVGDSFVGDSFVGDSGSIIDNPANAPLYASAWCAAWERGEQPALYPPDGPVPDPNADFYASVSSLTDSNLEDALRNKIDDHFVGTYDWARYYMLTQLSCDHGWVECVYTGMRVFTDCEMPTNEVMNTEHTWPKSRMVGSDEVDGSESDLHHLFPSQQRANSMRASLEFGNPLWQLEEIPADADQPEIISGARRGLDDDSNTLFESRIEHKGDVARALFYYAVRYDRAISPLEERALRCWNAMDPPDAKERLRNDTIASPNQQGSHNRNPFVDHPEYVERISNF